MIRKTLVGCLVALMPSLATAQPAPASPSRASVAVLEMVANIEKAITGAAEEMPAEKYAFVPSEGNFRGVRTFAQQIKHAAAVQHLVAATILGERVTADMSDERGPDSVRTKAEVLQYLKDSFAALKRAVATIDDTNAFEPFKGPFRSAPQTRLGVVAAAVSHSWNHYGQVVPYLRMNGFVPPRTP